MFFAWSPSYSLQDFTTSAITKISEKQGHLSMRRNSFACAPRKSTHACVNPQAHKHRDTRSGTSSLLRHSLYFYHSIINLLCEAHPFWISFVFQTTAIKALSFTIQYMHSGIMLSSSWKCCSHCCRKWEQQRSIDSLCYLMCSNPLPKLVILHDMWKRCTVGHMHQSLVQKAES